MLTYLLYLEVSCLDLMTEFHSMYLRQKCLILLLSRLKNLLLSLGVEFLYDDFDFLTEVEVHILSYCGGAVVVHFCVSVTTIYY